MDNTVSVTRIWVSELDFEYLRATIEVLRKPGFM